MKLQYYIKDFVNYLKFERQYSKNTILSYEIDLKQANKLEELKAFLS